MEELIATLVAPLVATVIVVVRSWLKARLTPERLAAVNQLARVAVEAAEEIGRATDASPGDKFTYAENFLKAAAKRVGIRLSNEEANGFIHAVLNGRHETIEDAIDAALAQMLDQMTDELDVVDVRDLDAIPTTESE